MSKLVLIDGNAIMHRSYHAMPKLTTKDGQPINAVYGFVSMLLRIITDLEPSHIAVCFDRKEPTFRKKEFKDYQAHRPETEKDLVGQFGKAKDTTKSFNIPIFEKAGFEADDLIGTIAKQTTKNKKIDQVIIVTGDKDILQLVDESIFVYLPIRGLSVAKMMSHRDVYGKLGVYPKQIVDLKALMGDPSDNYKGVPGIGPKTAEKLLSEYKTFPEIYKHLDEIPDTTARKLKEGKESGEMSYKLAKIICDVDFSFSVDNMGKWSVGSKETLKLFEKYNFKTLTRRVEKVGKELEGKQQGSLF